MKFQEGDMVGVMSLNGRAAVAKLLRIEKKPKKATMYVVFVDGESKERSIPEGAVYTQQWAVDSNRRIDDVAVRTRVDELSFRLSEIRSGSYHPVPGESMKAIMTTVEPPEQWERFGPGFHGPSFAQPMPRGRPTVSGVSGGELARICQRADEAAVLDRKVRYLSYLAAYMTIASGKDLVKEANEWIKINHNSYWEG